MVVATGLDLQLTLLVLRERLDHKGHKGLKGSKGRKEEDNRQFMVLTIGHGSKKVFSMVLPALLQQTMTIL
jgi:peptidyl-tRNA hydrolase